MIFIIVCAVLAIFVIDSKGRPVYQIPVVIIAAAAAFQVGVGNDYFAYEAGYYAIKNAQVAPWGSGSPLFNLLMVVAPSFYFFKFALFAVYGYFLTRLLKITADKRFVLFLFIVNPYIYLVHISGLRQLCAIMIITISAIKYGAELNKRNMLSLAVAFAFHPTSSIVSVGYLVSTAASRSKFTLIAVATLITLSVLLVLNGAYWQSVQFIPLNIIYYLQEGNPVSTLSWLYSVGMLCIFTVRFRAVERISAVAANFSIFYFFTAAFSIINEYFMRVAMYYEPLAMIGIAALVRGFSGKSIKALLYLFFGVIYAYKLSQFISSETFGPHYSEYRSIFSL
jgi:transmembrane protein EpsG